MGLQERMIFPKGQVLRRLTDCYPRVDLVSSRDVLNGTTWETKSLTIRSQSNEVEE